MRFRGFELWYEFFQTLLFGGKTDQLCRIHIRSYYGYLWIFARIGRLPVLIFYQKASKQFHDLHFRLRYAYPTLKYDFWCFCVCVLSGHIININVGLFTIHIFMLKILWITRAQRGKAKKKYSGCTHSNQSDLLAYSLVYLVPVQFY